MPTVTCWRRTAYHRPPADAAALAGQRWLGFDQSLQMIDGFKAAGIDVDRRFFSFRCDNQVVHLEAVRRGLGIGVVMLPLARRSPTLVPVLPGLVLPVLPVLPVWLTAHRELRASLRLQRVFDFLAQGLRAWGEGGG